MRLLARFYFLLHLSFATGLFGQETAWAEDGSEAIHSFFLPPDLSYAGFLMLLCFSFATGLFGQLKARAGDGSEAAYTFCVLQLSFATGLFGQVTVGLRIVCEAARSFLLHPAAFLCHWPFWTTEGSGWGWFGRLLTLSVSCIFPLPLAFLGRKSLGLRMVCEVARSSLLPPASFLCAFMQRKRTTY